jgi:hypothetical protein
MNSKQVQYSDYKSFIDTLTSSNHDFTYQNMIEKEEKVLDTMNNVIKYYNDNQTKEKEFVNQSMMYIATRLFTVWNDIFADVIKLNSLSLSTIVDIFMKDDRLVYIGITLLIISVMLYYLKLTS